MKHFFSTSIEGMTALYDGISCGLAKLREGRHEKKALVVICDGGDNASEATFKRVLKKAQEISTLIYTIGLYDKNDDDKDLEVLEELAVETGGRAFFPRRTSQLFEIAKRIALDLRRQYLSGFHPVEANEGKIPRNSSRSPR